MITKKLGAGVGEVSFVLSNKQNLIFNLYLTVQCFNDKSWDLIMIISRTHRLGLYRKGPTGEVQYFSETHTQTSESHTKALLHTPHMRPNVMTYEGILSWPRMSGGLRGVLITAADGSQRHRSCADWSNLEGEKWLVLIMARIRQDKHLIMAVVLVAQLWPTVCDPMDCSPPGSSVHGLLQTRILEWVAISSSNLIIDTQNVIKIFSGPGLHGPHVPI